MRFPIRSVAFATASLLPQLLAAQTAPPSGLWYATLEPVTGLEVSFGLKVDEKGGKLSGALLNGASKSRFTAVTWDGDSLVLALDHYDGKLVARREGDDLTGTFTRAIPIGKV